ncbi:uncharacterized protein ASCRUDRAFT_78940 [Ascoidea rubescens DSM 1968]|uniref:Uncharacterized protein n=1 Tax=Ascoidea rubescens DSM 1968 TaxID=1344418 RepID=A0A1D2VQV6_9ASCO|nr:hypothetical protein ASCRUDRAFT_78940 [Ascoidea rubescens DSM 1968]ODV63979.1 hypothetical protein ASCRUDRAFT_78940 [Ascoidea rubescens DSM 1968]
MSYSLHNTISYFKKQSNSNDSNSKARSEKPPSNELKNHQNQNKTLNDSENKNHINIKIKSFRSSKKVKKLDANDTNSTIDDASPVKETKQYNSIKSFFQRQIKNIKSIKSVKNYNGSIKKEEIENKSLPSSLPAPSSLSYSLLSLSPSPSPSSASLLFPSFKKLGNLKFYKSFTKEHQENCKFDEFDNAHVKVQHICSNEEKPNLKDENKEYDDHSDEELFAEKLQQTIRYNDYPNNNYPDNNKQKIPPKLSQKFKRVKFEIYDQVKYFDKMNHTKDAPGCKRLPPYRRKPNKGILKETSNNGRDMKDDERIKTNENKHYCYIQNKTLQKELTDEIMEKLDNNVEKKSDKHKLQERLYKEIINNLYYGMGNQTKCKYDNSINKSSNDPSEMVPPLKVVKHHNTHPNKKIRPLRMAKHDNQQEIEATAPLRLCKLYNRYPSKDIRPLRMAKHRNNSNPKSLIGEIMEKLYYSIKSKSDEYKLQEMLHRDIMNDLFYGMGNQTKCKYHSSINKSNNNLVKEIIALKVIKNRNRNQTEATAPLRMINPGLKKRIENTVPLRVINHNNQNQMKILCH